MKNFSEVKSYIDNCTESEQKLSLIMQDIFDENNIPDKERIFVLWGEIFKSNRNGNEILFVKHLKTLMGNDVNRNPYGDWAALTVFVGSTKKPVQDKEEVCIVLRLGSLKNSHELLTAKSIFTITDIMCDASLPHLDRINYLLGKPAFRKYKEDMENLLREHGLEVNARSTIDTLNEQINQKTSELNNINEKIKEIINRYAPQGIPALEDDLQNRQSLLTQLQEEIVSLQKEIKKARFFASTSGQDANNLPMICDSNFSYDTFTERIDYTYNDSIVVPFLMALSTNQIITLYGPPGTGKTTLVSKIAKALGAKCTIVSVQSSWTDTSDLLGYYSPIDKTYEGTDFIEALLDANQEWFDKGDNSRLHLICLDEMNLARIEYYFATFLSLLQLPENKRMIRLLPPYVEEALDRIASANDESVVNENTLADEEKYLLRLRKYHSFKFPPNVHFIGTINNDDTTNELSPKMRDRSMFIDLSSIEASKDKNLKIEDYYPLSFFRVSSETDIVLPDDFDHENNRFRSYASTMLGWIKTWMPDFDPYIDSYEKRGDSLIYNYLIITKILPLLRKNDFQYGSYGNYTEAAKVFDAHTTASEFFDLLGGNQ